MLVMTILGLLQSRRFKNTSRGRRLSLNAKNRIAREETSNEAVPSDDVESHHVVQRQEAFLPRQPSACVVREARRKEARFSYPGVTTGTTDGRMRRSTGVMPK